MTEEQETKHAFAYSPSNTGLGAMPNFWCEVCNKIQPTFFEGTHNFDVSGNFIGGDIVCKECSFIIATAYTPNVKLKDAQQRIRLRIQKLEEELEKLSRT